MPDKEWEELAPEEGKGILAEKEGSGTREGRGGHPSKKNGILSRLGLFREWGGKRRGGGGAPPSSSSFVAGNACKSAVLEREEGRGGEKEEEATAGENFQGK